VLFPVLGQRNTRFLSTTTPTSDDTYHYILTNKIVDGKLFVNKITNIQICEECAKTNHSEKCTHGQRSSHLDREGAYYVEQLYKEEDRDIMLNEVYNVETSNNVFQTFSSNIINKFIQTKAEIKEKPKMIFITIDPSYGGKSLAGVIAAAYIDLKYTVFSYSV